MLPMPLSGFGCFGDAAPGSMDANAYECECESWWSKWLLSDEINAGDGSTIMRPETYSKKPH